MSRKERSRRKGISFLLVLCIVVTMFLAGSGFRSEAKTGTWRKDGNGWYYSYSDGSYAKNQWLKYEGKWYRFGGNGYMQTGWKKISNKWYYFGKDGAMRVGWQKISGKWYYFSSQGVLAINQWIGKYCVGSSGAWISNASKTWAKKYKELILQNYNEAYEDPTYPSVYLLVYLDDNSTPELLHQSGKHGEATIYTYYNGKVVSHDIGTWYVNYIPKSGLYLAEENYKGYGWAKVVRLDKGEFTSLGGGSYDYPYFDPDFNGEEWKYSYSWGGKTVTKQQFESNINKLYKNRKGSVSFGRGSWGNHMSYNEIMNKLNSILK